MTQPTNYRAALEQAQGEASALDVHLDMEAVKNLLWFTGDGVDGEPSEIRLQIGDGHSGYGLYVSSFDYPEEGAIFLHSLPIYHQASEPAPNPWKEAVLDQLAIHAMDAPVETPPAEIIQSIIDMGIAMATDLRVTGEPAQGDRVEREAFEAWAARTICDKHDLQKRHLTGYGSQELNYLWRGWSARAALQSTALPDHSEQHLDMVAALPVGELTPVSPNESGATQCTVRWQVETPKGWLGAYDKEAFSAYLAAARAQPVLQPLTNAQIEEGRKATFSTDNPFCPCDSKTMRKAVWWAERAHGITPKETT